MRTRPGRMGDSLVYTPGQIKAEAETANTIISQLYRDAEASKKIPQKTRNAFYAFCNEWVAFYKNHTGWTDRLWFSTLEKITDYRRRAEDWRKLLTKQGLNSSGPSDHAPTPGIGEGAIPWKLIILGVVGVAGLLITWKIVSGVMLRGAQLGEAEKAAEAIAEAETRKKRQKKLYSRA